MSVASHSWDSMDTERQQHMSSRMVREFLGLLVSHPALLASAEMPLQLPAQWEPHVPGYSCSAVIPCSAMPLQYELLGIIWRQPDTDSCSGQLLIVRG